MLNGILALLLACHRRWRTTKEHHNLTLDTERNEVILAIFHGQRWYTFILEESDFVDLDIAIDGIDRSIQEQEQVGSDARL